jgi:hypothetical protein
MSGIFVEENPVHTPYPLAVASQAAIPHMKPIQSPARHPYLFARRERMASPTGKTPADANVPVQKRCSNRMLFGGILKNYL